MKARSGSEEEDEFFFYSGYRTATLNRSLRPSDLQGAGARSRSRATAAEAQGRSAARSRGGRARAITRTWRRDHGPAR